MIRAAGGLAIIGASLALAIQQLHGSWVEEFVHHNVLGTARRNRILISMAIGVLVGVCGAFGLMSVGGPREGLARTSRVARLLAPLALAGVIPSLLAVGAWTDTMSLCFVLTAVVLIFDPLWRLHFGAYLTDDVGWLRRKARAVVARVPVGVRSSVPVAALSAMLLFFAVYMSFYTVRAHFRFDTWTWDLGIFDNAFFNALHGRPFVETPLYRQATSWSALQDHAVFVMYPLLPFYAIHPAAETLLVLQALALAAGGIPLYRIASRRLSPGLSLIVVAAYLLYPPLHGVQMFRHPFSGLRDSPGDGNA